MLEILKRQCNTLYKISSANKDLVVLIIRVVIGVIFIQAGYSKLIGLEKTSGFFSAIGIPFPYFNAILVAVSEFVGGLFILFGFLTRSASIPNAIIMVVAIITVKLEKVSTLSDFIRLQELDYLIFFLLLICIGAGKYSIDSIWCKDCCDH